MPAQALEDALTAAAGDVPHPKHILRATANEPAVRRRHQRRNRASVAFEHQLRPHAPSPPQANRRIGGAATAQHRAAGGGGQRTRAVRRVPFQPHRRLIAHCVSLPRHHGLCTARWAAGSATRGSGASRGVGYAAACASEVQPGTSFLRVKRNAPSSTCPRKRFSTHSCKEENSANVRMSSKKTQLRSSKKKGGKPCGNSDNSHGQLIGPAFEEKVSPHRIILAELPCPGSPEAIQGHAGCQVLFSLLQVDEE